MEIPCPFCQTVLIEEPGRPKWYRCPNPDCHCEDGGMTLHHHRPLDWIEYKRKKILLKSSS